MRWPSRTAVWWVACVRTLACMHAWRGVCSPPTHLEAALQHPEWEAVGGLGGEPQPEVGVRLADLLQDLLQGLEPLGQQVAVLQEEGWEEDTQVRRALCA